MARQFGNHSLKEYMKKPANDGGLTDILRAEIKAILQTEVKSILNQTLDTKEEMILMTGNPNDKGAPGTSNPESNKRKGVMTMPKDIEDNYQEGFLQFSPNGVRVTKYELAMEIQELAYRVTQLELLVKENTITMTRGLNQLFMLMNELLWDRSKQPFHSQPDKVKISKMGCQNMVGYDPLHLEFLEPPTINLRSTQRKYARV